MFPSLLDPAGQEHLLQAAITTLGRAVENDVVITSKRASRAHARIVREGRKVVLEDLGSANGTFLNDERVLTPTALRDGDQITIGEIAFKFHDPDTTLREAPMPMLEVDVAAGVVRVDRRAVALSPKEFALLVYLYERRGAVCSKDEIAAAVWPEYEAGGIYDYQIENLVRRLRAKIEPGATEARLLITLRGLGYKLTGLSQLGVSPSA